MRAALNSTHDTPSMTDRPGGISNSGTIVTGGGHVAGGNITIHSPESVVDALEAKGVLQAAETAGLQRRVVVMLAQRLKPAERLDFEQAITELARAVEIAIEVVERGSQATTEDVVDSILAKAAQRTTENDLDGAAQIVDEAFAEFERRNVERRDAERRESAAILEAAIRQHTLRRNAEAVAERIERLVAIEHATERAAWHPAFRRRFDAYLDEGEAKDINFSLEVAIGCARRMAAAARDSDEHGSASLLLGTTLTRLGERERGPERLQEAVDAYHAALAESPPERVPLKWAMTQNNLGNALARLAERESGTARLAQAIRAYRLALEERTRERVPLEWAMTQHNIANALARLAERERGTARLREAIDAYHAVLQEWTRERVPFEWAMTQSLHGEFENPRRNPPCGCQ